MTKEMRHECIEFYLTKYTEQQLFDIYNDEDDVNYDYFRWLFEYFEWSIIKPIPGYSNYGALENGDIWSYRRKKKIKPCGERGNYQVICIKNDEGKYKTPYVHRLVASAWIPNPDNLPEINHIDHNKENNCVSNLEWCTRSENMHHSSRAVRIYCLNNNKYYNSIIEAAKELNLCASNICSCCKGVIPHTKRYMFKYAEEVQI